MFSTTLGSGNIDHVADLTVVNHTIQLPRGKFSALSAGDFTSSGFKDLGNTRAMVGANDHTYLSQTFSASFQAA